ncbi:HIT family protein [Enterovirga aerilata]|uniref:HIT family protein n=1 Tax=Enterovirga aerilata TaxID=2730920 RepID=A0A849I453_9HYPH|nr:HIT family protein [Enterovirga sp. DB1703]NNM72138.1 HIT family protein [Enterovirga sp. DB1703]
MSAYDPSNVFAKILRGEMPAEKVYEDAKTLAFMDIMPRTDGHVLVIPKAPARTFFDLGQEDLAALFASVQKVARAAVAGLGADGLSIQQFNEPAGGQVVFHMHVHVLPRWNGVSLRPHTGEMAPRDVLAANAEKIRAALKA